MSAKQPWLSRHRVKIFSRLLGIITLTLAASGVLLLYAPLEEASPIPKVTEVAPRQLDANRRRFPQYRDYQARRETPFGFRDFDRESIRTIEFITEGLELISTSADPRAAFAQIYDDREEEVAAYVLGDQVRNATLAEVHPEHVVLELDGARKELKLPAN